MVERIQGAGMIEQWIALVDGLREDRDFLAARCSDLEAEVVMLKTELRRRADWVADALGQTTND